MNRREFLGTLPAIALLNGCGGCGKPEPVEHPITVPAGSSDFAFDLYGRLSKQPSNLIFSPLSITIALAMSSRGADGQTLAEIEKVLRLPLGDDQTHAAFGDFIS